jgi:hypothetical protein
MQNTASTDTFGIGTGVLAVADNEPEMMAHI